MSPTGTGTIDITDVVNKYKLQSAMIQQVNGGLIANSNADTPPSTPASTMKLIIADTVLRNGINLNQTVHVGSDVYYDGGNDLGTSSVTLQHALDAMLSVSSNVGANVLMKALGGVNAFTQKAQGYGYTHTTVAGYYDPSNDGKNSSTISDEVAAMNHIFSASSNEYVTAQGDLKSAAQNDNHYNVANVVANKWAGTSTVAGNVGLFHINNKDYVIGLYYNGSDASSEAITAVKDGSKDLANLVENGGGPSANQAGGGGCCPVGGAGVAVSGSISPQVGKGMSPTAQQKFQQYAVAAGQKFNVDPNFVATFYYTEMGRTGDSTNNADAASGSPVTGDGNWIEPAPPVGNGDTYIKNSGGYWEPYGLGDGSNGSFDTMGAYGKDGDGDGKVEPNNLADAMFTAANLLASDGAKVGASQSKLKDVAYLYNHADTYARSVMNTYNYLTGKGSASVSGTTGAAGCAGGAAVDCSGSSGTEKILCAAKAYEGIYYEYGGGHQGYSAFKSGCPDPSNPPNNQPSGGPVNGDPAGLSGNPSPCGLDCSSLVSVAVDDAFGQSYMWTVAGSMQGAGADKWHSVPMSQAKAGDIVTSSGHVEIVDHVSGGTVYTFGAHNTGEKIGGTSFDTSYFTGGAWRWAGPGSS